MEKSLKSILLLTLVVLVLASGTLFILNTLDIYTAEMAWTYFKDTLKILLTVVVVLTAIALLLNRGKK